LTILGLFTVGLYYLIVARYAGVEWGIQYHVYALPYYALTAATGVEWFLQQHNRLLAQVLIGLSIAVFLGSAGLQVYRMMFPGGNTLVKCAQYVNQLVPGTDHIIVSTTSFAIDQGVPNNYQEPEIFFYSKRYGWSLPADRHTVTEVKRLEDLGATHIVIYSRPLLEDNPELLGYLETNAAQIGPGIDQACAIYRFTK
jgi:hypothetical protein